MANPPDLSVILPARNESKRLPHTLTRLASYARKSTLEIEVLVVDDHSEDDTRYVASQLVSRLEVRVISSARRGPGAAMRT
ncbi:MAG: glycosyltransferase, partial [Myxococcota bacterium]